MHTYYIFRGSGAMSHAIIRSISPSGTLHTFEFNKNRADKAREEFTRNKVDRMVIVHDRDVCGKQPSITSSSNVVVDSTVNNTNNSSNSILNNNNNEEEEEEATTTRTTTSATQNSAGGFGIGGQIADAIFLDLPEPWLAVPHAAYTIKPNGQICSYSPCVEQTQRCVAALRECGFHSIKTMEARLREYYVDDVELESPPKARLPRAGVEDTTTITTANNAVDCFAEQPSESESATSSSAAFPQSSKKFHRFPDSEDTGAEADNERSEAEEVVIPSVERNGPINSSSASTAVEKVPTKKKKLCARPFPIMRGHTAFLTFATAGLKIRPDPSAV
jgi:tRNA A58 N-methylase Trm61